MEDKNHQTLEIQARKSIDELLTSAGWLVANTTQASIHAAGTNRYTPEQIEWLEMIRGHIASNPGIEPDDFEYAPFLQHGGLGIVHQLFGDKLNMIREDLNETLAV